ncbi:MAG: DUF1800 family protein, partial [bacterium]
MGAVCRLPGVLFVCVGVALVAAELSLSARQETPGLADTVRFLEQSTFGPNEALIDKVREQGFEAFLTEQFDAGLAPYPDLPPMPATRPADCVGACQRDNYTMYPLQVHFFQNALGGNDQLRQRVAWALSQILVVSGLDVT